MLSFAQATDALDKLIDRDQDFRLLGTGFGFTEGPAWNTPGNYLVFSDIPGDRRWRWSEQRGMELVAWPTYKGNGNPDGMECDELGNIWCTARGGIWVIAPAGDLLGIIETPEVSGSLVWGGADMRSLFVCTSTTMHMIRTKVGTAPLPY
jgi:sugar lactone lactonase YvrE